MVYSARRCLRAFATGALLVASASVLQAKIADLTVTSAANFSIGVPRAGSVAALFCTGLIGIQGIVIGGGPPLTTEIQGIRVTVGGAQAPLFAVAELGGYQQINLQIPWEAQFVAAGTPSGITYTVQVTVEQNGETATATLPAVAASPGEFFVLPNGVAAFQHSRDYSLVTADNPAQPGEILVAYLTGMGVTEPSIPTGAPAPFAPLSTVPQSITSDTVHVNVIVVDSTLVVPMFVGLTPGSVGLYQVNFAVPSTISDGMHNVVLQYEWCANFLGQRCPAQPMYGSAELQKWNSQAVSLPVKAIQH
jgi:uncharacterized protein (TIGR03437 family)